MKRAMKLRTSTAMLLWLLALLLAACARPTPLLRPNGVAVAVDGSVYVMDRGNYRIAHFGADGRLRGAFGKFGVGPENIHSGWDMGLDSHGNLYICNFVFSEDDDLIHDGVKVFTPAGQFLREVGGQDYAADRLARKPYGLDIDAQDRVYIADFNTSTLRVFDAQGRALGTFFGEVGAAPGQFNGINDVAVDDARALVYLVDNINCRVQQFALAFTAAGTPELTFVRSFGEYGDGVGQLAYPQGIAVDEATGRIYVADNANRRIQVFDVEGQNLASFAPLDVHNWQVLLLTVGPDGSIYATDGYNNVIWVFEPDGAVRRRIEVVP
ncbi:MAG TPA: NHL repeat-containing protein [Anaerolineae bacterium]|nr:NHL repeat-containing protein [Anaerolineae bacterium]HQI84048.1 NHL repeat-containing protein [Anaerolineae bacterium]